MRVVLKGTGLLFVPVQWICTGWSSVSASIIPLVCQTDQIEPRDGALQVGMEVNDGNSNIIYEVEAFLCNPRNGDWARTSP